jgi:hypothetical protein
MHGYAQTNLQLYAQLTAVDCDEQTLAKVARAHDLAIELLGGLIRPNGKPFLCHLVGTASILAAWRCSHGEMIAGLLHAVYSHGDFSGTPRGMTAAKRAVVHRAIGAEDELLIAEYFRVPWNVATIEQLAERLNERLNELSELERSVVRVRIANELEEHLDLGMAYCRKTKSESLPAAHAALRHLAESLVSREAADELARVFSEHASAKVPDFLRRDAKRSFRTGERKRPWLARLVGAWR